MEAYGSKESWLAPEGTVTAVHARQFREFEVLWKSQNQQLLGESGLSADMSVTIGRTVDQGSMSIENWVVPIKIKCAQRGSGVERCHPRHLSIFLYPRPMACDSDGVSGSRMRAVGISESFLCCSRQQWGHVSSSPARIVSKQRRPAPKADQDSHMSNGTPAKDC